MAKYEANLRGNFHELLRRIDDGILNGSFSASREDGSDWQSGGVRCAVRVYERYSMMGSNRVSLNVTLIDSGNGIFLSAITSGGSQAVLFKINTWSEESFLDCIVEIVEEFRS